MSAMEEMSIRQLRRMEHQLTRILSRTTPFTDKKKEQLVNTRSDIRAEIKRRTITK
jgi:hypothetical protein